MGPGDRFPIATMLRRHILYSGFVVLAVLLVESSVTSSQLDDVRFLFTTGLHYRSDSALPPKFEYQIAIPQPVQPYVTFYHQTSPVVAVPPPPLAVSRPVSILEQPLLQHEGVEQYQGERAYKHQRKLAPKQHYGGTTAGRALAFSYGSDRRHFFGTPLEQPRYRYTQVGLTYGHSADHFRQDGGYGPYDPHGTREYDLATGGRRSSRSSYPTVRRY